MRLAADETLDRFDDNVVRVSTLEDLDDELITECISEQVENPFLSRSNYLEEFKENFDEEIEEANGDSDEISRLKHIANNFYFKVIYMIEKKFNLDIDHDTIESLTNEAIRNLAEGMYEFFIINYVDNVSKYLSSKVIWNKDAIVDVIKDEHGNNVVMNALTAKINDKSYAYLLGNINRAINLIKDDEITPSEFIEEFNSDEFGTVIVKYAINTGLICGDFVNDFLDPILGHSQDDMYDIVALNVQQAVYRDYRKYIKTKAGE